VISHLNCNYIYFLFSGS